MEYARMLDMNSNAFLPIIFHIDDALICEQGMRQADGLKSLARPSPGLYGHKDLVGRYIYLEPNLAAS